MPLAINNIAGKEMGESELVGGRETENGSVGCRGH